MIQKVNFSQKELNAFAEILGALKEVSHPPFEEIQPIVQIHKPENQIYSDNGKYELKELNRLVQTDQDLPSHIKFIQVDGMPWFYKDDDAFSFYSAKKHVTLDFAPQRLIEPKMLQKPQLLNCVKKMLALIGQRNISREDAEKVFPEDVCRKVYELTPPREHILSALGTSIEGARHVLFEHMVAYHEKEIRQLPEFQAFQTANPKAPNILFKFLKYDCKGFELAEEWGYITNAKELIAFQNLRHVPRHMDKYAPNPILSEETALAMTPDDWERWIYHRGYPYQSPKGLYDGFCKALFFVTPKTPKDTISYDDSTTAIWALKDVDQWKNIMETLPNKYGLEKCLKKNFPQEISTPTVIVEKDDATQTSEQVVHFSSFYIRKDGIAPERVAQEQPDGTILIKQEDFHDWRDESDTYFHANPGYQKGARILSEEIWDLSDFVGDFVEVYQKADLSQLWARHKAQQKTR